MRSPTIRFARPSDVPALHALILALAEYERAPDAVRAAAGDLSRALFGEPPAAEALVVVDGDRVLGFALFFATYSTWTGRRGLWLEDLFVLPDRRGEGLGRALLARLAALAVERGCARLEWNVLDWNEPALAFYRSLGAQSLAEWTVHRLDGEALATLARWA